MPDDTGMILLLEEEIAQLKQQNNDMRLLLSQYQGRVDTVEKAEHAEHKRAAILDRAFHCSPCMISITSCVDHRYLDVNDTFLNFTGFTRDEVIGHDISDLGWKAASDEAKNLMKGEAPFKNFEVAFTRRSGPELKVLLSREVIYINKEPCFLYVGIDITEHKLIEEEMARLDRLNLIGQAAASIAHEIRNPMTVVRGYLQLLQMKKEYAPERQRLDVMIEEIDRANMIITEFLSVAKNIPMELKKHNINNILIDLLPLINAEAVRSGKSVSILLGRLPQVYVDEKQIGRMVLHLAQNGLEAMPEKGMLSIKTFCDGDEVVLSVKDQGEGISSEILEKIGTPFFTTKPNGAGLGLAVCYRIAERHNARISIETGPEGTTFMVRFKK